VRGDQVAEVTPIELFFDLVYVLAVTQLTRHLLAGLTGRGALETLVLLLAVFGSVESHRLDHQLLRPRRSPL
jgi:low temperature requirement protein LtrA